MRTRMFLYILILSLLSSCSLSYELKDKQKEKNISVLLNKMEDSSKMKSKVPFNGVKANNGNINVLIVGVDSRGEERSRSDAIMVAQYSPRTNKGKIITIMRDSYVEIPGSKHRFNKINHSYYKGGPELLRKTIKQNFDIDVEHFITIDFEGFVKVVDIVSPDGIEVNLNQKIIDDMGLKLNPGIQKLHGKDLLAYVRFRHDHLSDFGRVQRQQEVLTALKNEFMNEINSVNGVIKLQRIGEELTHYIDTDMDFETFASLSSRVLLNQVKEVETMRIPVQKSYSDQHYPHAGQVLKLDLGKNKEAVKEFFVDKPKPVIKEKRKQ